MELNDKIIKSTGAMFNLGNVMLTLAGTMYMGRLIFAVRNITGLFGGLIGRSTAAGGALGNLSNTSAGTARGLGGTARAGGALNQTLTRMPGPVLRATSAIGGLAIEIAAISAGVGVAAFGIGKLVSAIRGVPDEININGQDIAQLAMAVNALEERKVGLVSQLSNNLAGLQGSINNLQVGPLREMSGLLAQFSAIGGINFNFNADNIAKLQGVITELKSLDPDKPAAMAAMFGQAARKAQVESKLVRYGDAQGGVQITNLAIPPIQIEATLNGQRVASILAEEITPVIAARVAHALRTR